jgi:subtilisin family serine protease/subtilisin-like proprotein convertase family protein
MKKSSMTLLSLIALSGSSFGDSAASIVSGQAGSSGTHQFSQGGLINNLTLCTYELCHLDESGRLKITPVAAGSTSAIVSQASEPGAEKYLVFYPVGEQRNPNARRILRTRYIVKLADGANVQEVQQRCGIGSMKLVREGSNLAICEEDSAGKVLAQLARVTADPEVISAEPVFSKKRFKRAIPTDPFYDTIDNPRADGAYQWSLNNIGVNGGVASVDIKFEAALDRATGQGVTVAVIDDGLSIDHADLAANATGPHLNLLDGADDDPTTFDAALTHGTSVASLIAAAFNNGEGMSGVAPNATLSGIRLFGGDGLTNDADEAAALSFQNDTVDIYNASWGPDDTTLDLEGPGSLTRAALENGVLFGRSGPATPGNQNPRGLGNIFVWAAGDGGLIGDNSNYDGYANSRFTIAVGSVDDAGRRAAYSERGANLVVVAPSDGGAQDLLAASYGLDVDEDDNPIRTTEYINDFGGTSASAALVSGVVALMLEENEDLSWRDVQDILIRTAFKVDDDNAEWETNAAGFDFNHNYGAGLVDAAAAVQEAFRVNSTNAFLGEAVEHSRSAFFTSNPVGTPEEPTGVIPDNTGGSLFASFDMTQGRDGTPFENLRVEHVEFNATIITPNRADLEVVLISPNGTQSILSEVNTDHEEDSIFFWNFMTVRNWGEGSAGTWVVRVSDRVTGNQAVLNNASLTIHGSVDPDAPVNQIPILTSSRVIDVNQGSSFVYNLETSGATQIEVTDLPPGVAYDPNTQIISGTPTDPGLYAIGVVLTDADGNEGNFAINVVVRPTAVALGDAVGLPDFPAIFEGDAPWDFELTDTNDGDVAEPRSARSAIGLTDNQTSTFGFDGLAPGVLLFDWKTSSEEGSDRLWVNRGGSVPQIWEAFISGERSWARSAIVLPDVSNNVRWIYTKDGAGTSGEDRGLVDNVELVPMDKFMADIRSAANIEGFDFELDSRALFLPTTLDGISPPPEGGSPSALVTPAIGNGQTASISGWVNGPGTFSFIAVNLAEPADVLEFLVDGVVLATGPGFGTAGGLVDFFTPGAAGIIPPGRHRVQIRFRKDFSGSDAAIRTSTGLPFDGALLDDIKFVPDNNFDNFVSQYGTGFDPSPEADADGDGYSNHQEYAFGGNVLVADIPSYLPQLVVDGALSYIEYGIDPNRPDLNYAAQQSTDLENWQAVELASLHRVEGNYEIYRIPVIAAQGRRHLYYRVVASAK